MVDLRGFTALALRLPPREVMALLGDYQHRMVPLVRAHGGTGDKFMGDGILASFGALTPLAAPAARVLAAMEAILAEAERWARERQAAGQPAVPVVVAAALGEVLCGTVGVEERLEFTVIGPPVDLAAKLEKHAKHEGAVAVVPAALLAQAEREGYVPVRPWQPRAARRVEGVERQLDLAVVA